MCCLTSISPSRVAGRSSILRVKACPKLEEPLTCCALNWCAQKIYSQGCQDGRLPCFHPPPINRVHFSLARPLSQLQQVAACQIEPQRIPQLLLLVRLFFVSELDRLPFPIGIDPPELNVCLLHPKLESSHTIQPLVRQRIALKESSTSIRLLNHLASASGKRWV